VEGELQSVENVFLIASALYVSYIISGFLAHPNWRTAAFSSVIPHLSPDQAYITMLIGLVGTTISPWMQFYVQASVIEKRVSRKRLEYSRLDAISGSIASNFVAVFIVVACAATIFVNGSLPQLFMDVSLSSDCKNKNLSNALLLQELDNYLGIWSMLPSMFSYLTPPSYACSLLFDAYLLSQSEVKDNP
jgi:Mn2+/Fe2+ NRAMP family transporter